MPNTFTFELHHHNEQINVNNKAFSKHVRLLQGTSLFVSAELTQ